MKERDAAQQKGKRSCKIEKGEEREGQADVMYVQGCQRKVGNEGRRLDFPISLSPSTLRLRRQRKVEWSGVEWLLVECRCKLSTSRNETSPLCRQTRTSTHQSNGPERHSRRCAYS